MIEGTVDEWIDWVMLAKDNMPEFPDWLFTMAITLMRCIQDEIG